MVRRVLFACALTVVGAFAYTNSAFAAPGIATDTVTFSGTVANACTITGSGGGTLTQSGNTLTTSGAAPTRTVTCNAAGSVTVAAPTEQAADPIKLTGAAATATINGGSSVALSTNTPVTATINMTVDNGSNAIAAGTYNYDVVVTATAP